jgi:hypothetical protein
MLPGRSPGVMTRTGQFAGVFESRAEARALRADATPFDDAAREALDA